MKDPDSPTAAVPGGTGAAVQHLYHPLLLHECLSKCDGDFQEERTLLPLHRAARGKQLSLVVRYPNTGRQQVGQHWED